eukprot:IDg10975t1
MWDESDTGFAPHFEIEIRPIAHTAPTPLIVCMSTRSYGRTVSQWLIKTTLYRGYYAELIAVVSDENGSKNVSSNCNMQ